jgi:branched-chain amino acid transport system ATP-binding protein
MFLSVQKITKRFGGLVALNDVSFNVDEGEIIGLIGPNGAGKSTMFNVITGFYKPESGTVNFQGKDITGLSPNKICIIGIARTFQQVRPFLNSTVLENILCGAICRINRLEISRSKALEILKWLNLDKKEDILVKNLTIFERKLVELGRAIATQPKLMLVDEAVAGLNPTEIGRFIRLIREVRDSGISLILVEHVMKFVMEVSEKVVVLNWGVKIAEGKPEEVLINKKVIESYLGRGYA